MRDLEVSHFKITYGRLTVLKTAYRNFSSTYTVQRRVPHRSHNPLYSVLWFCHTFTTLTLLVSPDCPRMSSRRVEGHPSGRPEGLLSCGLSRTSDAFQSVFLLHTGSVSLTGHVSGPPIPFVYSLPTTSQNLYLVHRSLVSFGPYETRSRTWSVTSYRTPYFCLRIPRFSRRPFPTSFPVTQILSDKSGERPRGKDGPSIGSAAGCVRSVKGLVLSCKWTGSVGPSLYVHKFVGPIV